MPTSSAEVVGPREQRAHLRLAEVAAGYGAAPVIQDVSMTVALGEVVTVIGPNGAGKSTLLKTVLGLLRPSRGTITLAGEQIAGLPANKVSRRGVGYVPQVKDVFEPLTVRENLEIGGYTLPRGEVATRIDEVMERYPALAAAEIAGLAPQLAHELLTRNVTQLAGNGVAVLLVEQHAYEALAISDWAYVMAAGQVRLSDAAAALAQRPDLGDIFLGQAVGPGR